MENSYFRELSRRLRLEGVESDQREDQLDILLRGEPVFYVSLASDVFLLPAGSNDLEVSELYHQVAIMADEVAWPCSTPLIDTLVIITHDKK